MNTRLSAEIPKIPSQTLDKHPITPYNIYMPDEVTLNQSPDVSDEPMPDTAGMSYQLLRTHLKKEISHMISWGCTNARTMIERFHDPNDPRLTKEFVKHCIEETFSDISRDLLTRHPGAEVMGYLVQLETITQELNTSLKYSVKPTEVSSVANALIKTWKAKIDFLERFGVMDKDEMLKTFQKSAQDGRLLGSHGDFLALEAQTVEIDEIDAEWENNS